MPVDSKRTRQTSVIRARNHEAGSAQNLQTENYHHLYNGSEAAKDDA